eukprot:PhF_6_TR6073/c0_g1_i13/m.8840
MYQSGTRLSGSNTHFLEGPRQHSVLCFELCHSGLQLRYYNVLFITLCITILPCQNQLCFSHLACSSKFSIRSRKWGICLSVCAISLSNSTLGTKASRFREVLEVVGFAVVRGGVQGTGVLLRDLFGGGTACLHCTTDGGNLDNFDSNFCTVRLI